MMDLRYEALQINLDLNPDGLTGDISQDVENAYVLSLVGGRAVTVDANGYVALCDGAASTSCAGFLLLDAKGGFFENVPALASRKVSVTASSVEFETDQYVDSETIASGALVYAASGADAGKLTATAGATLTAPLGIVTKGNTAESPLLRVLSFGPVA